MKKIFTFAVFTVMLSLMLGVSSCSSDKSADATGLFKTIPADAGYVAVANMQNLLEKAGCKVDEDKIEAGKEVTAMLPKVENLQFRKLLQTFFTGESGVDPSVIAIFNEGYYTYLTGYASDPAKFKATTEKEFSVKFGDNDGVSIADNVAVIGNQFWVNLGQHNIDVRDVKHFSNLDNAQSFNNSKYAESLREVEKDIEGWGNIGGMLNTANFSFQDRATIQVALETLFTDPSAFTFSAEFKKGEAEFMADILNSKGEFAKYKFPTEKLDLKTIEGIGGNAVNLVAVAIPQKMISQLLKDTEKQSPSVFGIYLKALSDIDGTIAVASDLEGNSLKGVMTTNGENGSQLAGSLKSMFGVDAVKENKLVKFTKGTISGGKPVAELTKYLDGSIAGFVSAQPAEIKGNAKKLDGVAAFTLSKKDDGIRLKFNITAQGDAAKQNFILTLLQQ